MEKKIHNVVTFLRCSATSFTVYHRLLCLLFNQKTIHVNNLNYLSVPALLDIFKIFSILTLPEDYKNQKFESSWTLKLRLMSNQQ